jgi:hypothetical protein
LANEETSASKPGVTAEVETLVWLAESKGIDRRRYGIVNRLRSVRDSEQYWSLPDHLRKRVREIVADSEG